MGSERFRTRRCGPKRAARAGRRRAELALWAHGRLNLGLATDEIGRLTPGQFAALNSQYEANRDRDDWRFALIVCTLANPYREKGQKPLEPADVMPWLKKRAGNEPETKGDKPLSPTQARAFLEELTLEMGGIVHPRNVPLDLK